MDPSPPNPFSGAGDGGDGDDFDAFALSPVAAAASSPMPSLQSIQMQEQRQMQQQRQPQPAPPQPQPQPQQQQQPTFDGLPSPVELAATGQMSGPMTDASGSGGGWPPPPPLGKVGDVNFNVNHGGGGNQSFLSRILTCGGTCSVEALRPYFDVDTADVAVRMKGSIQYALVADGFRNEVLYSDHALRLAHPGGSGEGGGGAGADGGGAPTVAGASGGNYGSSTAPTGGKGPDLYGPVWITQTLAFSVAAASNASLYLHHKKMKTAEEEWDYDVNQLLHATWILYAFSVGLPSLLYFLLRLTGAGGPAGGGGGGPGLVELVCLYGYSLVPYLPAAWLCVAPAAWLQWLVLAAATAASGALVLRNVAGRILEGGGVQGKGGGLIMCLVGCHFVFFLVMKLAFYHHA